MNRLKGNEGLKRSLKNALSGRLPQTVLVSGDDSEGLKTVSEWLASGILCESDTERPCGKCASCRKAKEGVHPDLTIIDEGEDELKIELARRLRQEDSLIPNEGGRRVTVIRHAQNLNMNAQNALLKELEEPPPFAFFILTSERPDALLETVRSRCAKFSLEPSNSFDINGEAAQMLKPYLEALSSRREDKLMKSAISFEKVLRRELPDVLDTLGTAIRDAVFYAENLPEKPLIKGLQKETKMLAGVVSTKKLLELYVFTKELKGRIARNASSAAVTCALTSDVYRICFL